MHFVGNGERFRFLAVLIFGLLLPQFAVAQMRCLDLFPPAEIAVAAIKTLGDVSTNLNKTPVKQCVGTCYFEATVAVLEAKLSKTLGTPTTISRIHAFSYLALFRYAGITFQNSPKIFFGINSKDGLTDFMSSGNAMMMEMVLNNQEVTLMGPKSQAQIYVENKNIASIYKNIAGFVYEALHGTKRQTSEDSNEAPLARVQILKEALPEVKSRLKDFLQKIHLPTTGFLASAGMKWKTLSTSPDMQAPRQFLNRKTEQEIIDRLASGEELYLGYTHIRPYLQTINGRPGFLRLPEGTPMAGATAIKLDGSGEHAASVVDIIKNASGRIEYLVIRNSWGSAGLSDGGYHYVSVEYLLHYGITLMAIDLKI